jgi:plastocyanin
VRILFAAAVAVSIALVSATATASSEVPVTIVSRAYQPAELTVEDGQTVIWTNRGFGPHTVTALGGEFDSGRLNAGESFKVTFTTPGAFAYKCTVHPSMKGSVTVLPPGQHPLPPLGSLHVHLSHTRGARPLTLVHVQVPVPNAAVLLQFHYPSGTPWRTVRRARLSAQGTATIPLGAHLQRSVRVVVRGAGGAALIGKPLRAG